MSGKTGFKNAPRIVLNDPPSELRKWLSRQAKKDRRSVSGWIIVQLENLKKAQEGQ